MHGGQSPPYPLWFDSNKWWRRAESNRRAETAENRVTTCVVCDLDFAEARSHRQDQNLDYPLVGFLGLSPRGTDLNPACWRRPPNLAGVDRRTGCVFYAASAMGTTAGLIGTTGAIPLTIFLARIILSGFLRGLRTTSARDVRPSRFSRNQSPPKN